ncbi:MAG TPA: hypothetical protein VN880_15080, partial [Solirubrobacteraceae bacterium]|nr:hypothetical protein [Solirubrobacteraceae bacterium]
AADLLPVDAAALVATDCDGVDGVLGAAAAWFEDAAVLGALLTALATGVTVVVAALVTVDVTGAAA